MLKAKIKAERPDLNFGVACIPENLRLGDAISRYRSPDLIVIGADSERDWAKAEELFAFVDKAKIKRVSLKTAEMVKHSINTFLASQITLSNELGNLSDALGINWDEVADVLRLEPRIGKKALLRAGLGFAGGTLSRDVNVLRELGKGKDVGTVVLDAIMLANRNQNDAIVAKIARRYGGLKGLKIGVLGLTYKPETSTIRRSTSIEIIQKLVASGAAVRAYDPKAEFSEADAGVRFERVADAYSTAESADALLILTGWSEFKELDTSKIKAKMRNPVIIDAVNILVAR
jgi:UDPglucose 6-dehydrogenase